MEHLSIPCIDLLSLSRRLRDKEPTQNQFKIIYDPFEIKKQLIERSIQHFEQKKLKGHYL